VFFAEEGVVVLWAWLSLVALEEYALPNKMILMLAQEAVLHHEDLRS
jgi:hypothetical protein